MQVEFLQSIFVHGVGTARQAVQSSPPDIAGAAVSLSLLCRVLEWDFRHTRLPGAVASGRVFFNAEVRPACGQNSSHMQLHGLLAVAGCRVSRWVLVGSIERHLVHAVDSS